MNFQLRPHQERGLDAMLNHNRGQLIMPTGAGKTPTMICDAVREFSKETPQTVVVVCPRILLASQLSSEFLEFITNAKVFHVHSGEVHWESSTRPLAIRQWVESNESHHKLIVTTYHSLNRLQQAEIDVDTIYMDEAHNSVQRHFFPATEHFSANARRAYFFTATPKHSLAMGKPGMNDAEVYGQVICKVPAPELVKGGYIVPPKVIVKQLPMVTGKQTNFDRDAENLLETIDENSVGKILICAKATKQIVALVSETDFCAELEQRGYSWMYITAKTGAVIDGRKVNREVFFDTLSAWGKDNTKKFVVLHHSILAEGINVSGLEAVLFLRNMDFIGISQTIGRCIRLHHDDAQGMRDGRIQPGNLSQYSKSFGLVCIPVYSKVGIATARSVQAVVDTIFERGEPAVSVVRR
jgi:superfamily II DNA or RNA helicase